MQWLFAVIVAVSSREGDAPKSYVLAENSKFSTERTKSKGGASLMSPPGHPGSVGSVQRRAANPGEGKHETESSKRDHERI
ncbi:hypothetical protein G9C98_003837 [Cotesia typhae]|uniref:Uncharacterized protein n=1 Tax=Cotesia typhae TaxID=2053667 RepID=A0A8J5QN11_9HYME|nr:hypothetical protein G9C98_003837 [Cotesia typhae]